MQIPTLIFLFLPLLCFASTQECENELAVENFLSGVDGIYNKEGRHSKKPVYRMNDKCIWCQHYKMYFFVTNSIVFQNLCLFQRFFLASLTLDVRKGDYQ